MTWQRMYHISDFVGRVIIYRSEKKLEVLGLGDQMFWTCYVWDDCATSM